MIEGQGKGIEVMLLGARSRVTNSGGLRVLPAGAAGVVVLCGVPAGREAAVGMAMQRRTGNGGGEREKGEEGGWGIRQCAVLLDDLLYG